MSRQWIPVSAEQAKAHPLYGRGGWLAVFAFTVVIGLIICGAFWAVVLTARIAPDPTIRFLESCMAVAAAAAVIILVLFIARSQHFRAAATSLIVAPWPVLVALNYNQLPLSLLLVGSVAWLILTLLWVTYLQRSRRVRVTFERCVAGHPSYPRSEPTSAWPQPDAVGGPAAPSFNEPALQQHIDEIDGYQPEIDMSDTDPAEQCWALALAEYDSDRRKPGLWARAYAEAQGDEAVAKAAYLKHRAAQLFDAHQEKAQEIVRQHQVEQEAVEMDRRYEASLTDHERKIKRAIEEAEAGDDGSLYAMINLINVLGGKVERKSSVISPGWVVELAGYTNKFSDDEELRNWAMTEVLPRARKLLPGRR